ncbi:hypothetical protein, partial [Acetomicrobium mobile]|uniref:hypothetical protein n=1 Tax=Acetomicrobium mobile TaxID=97477 RepID=UPI0026EAD89C
VDKAGLSNHDRAAFLTCQENPPITNGKLSKFPFSGRADFQSHSFFIFLQKAKNTQQKCTAKRNGNGSQASTAKWVLNRPSYSGGFLFESSYNS